MTELQSLSQPQLALKPLNRFERSAIRAFFTLPDSILSLPHSSTITLFNKPFYDSLKEANAINKDSTKYFIIWFDSPDQLSESTGDRIDLSFRDFSSYGELPVVLIRQRHPR